MQEQERVKENSGIYKITNIVNNKVYIGSSSRLHQRFIKHKNDLDGGRHTNKHLQSSYDKYGRDSFVFEIIEICNKDIFLEREQFYCDLYKSNCKAKGYNKRLIVESNRGFSFKMPPSAKEELRRQGIERGRTDEFKKFMSNLHKGKEVSSETRKKMSESHKGNKMSNEAKLKLSEHKSQPIVNMENGEVYQNTKECSEKLGISKSTIFNWLSGKYRAKVKLKRVKNKSELKKVLKMIGYEVN